MCNNILKPFIIMLVAIPLLVSASHSSESIEFTGIVEKGHQMARTLGFPTANISPENFQLEPGVYGCRVTYNGKPYKSMGYVGEERPKMFEAHLFDMNKEFYGQEITVKILFFLRKSLPFISLDNMSEQLKKDAESVLNGFAEIAYERE